MAKVNRVGRRLAYRARKDPPFDENGAISPTENEHRNALVKDEETNAKINVRISTIVPVILKLLNPIQQGQP